MYLMYPSQLVSDIVQSLEILSSVSNELSRLVAGLSDYFVPLRSELRGTRYTIWELNDPVTQPTLVEKMLISIKRSMLRTAPLVHKASNQYHSFQLFFSWIKSQQTSLDV